MFTNSQQINEINKKVWGQLSIFTEINANVKKRNVKLNIESHGRESQKGEVGE